MDPVGDELDNGEFAERLPCAWCDEPGMWPDACREGPGDHRGRCVRMIEIHCGLGDHRRCEPTACVVAARWHEPVRTAGIDAARAAGTRWAVVSTIENTVEVVGTDDDLDRATSLTRNGCLKRAGVPLGFEGRGLVYVVRGVDGGLF